MSAAFRRLAPSELDAIARAAVTRSHLRNVVFMVIAIGMLWILLPPLGAEIQGPFGLPFGTFAAIFTSVLLMVVHTVLVMFTQGAIAEVRRRATEVDGRSGFSCLSCERNGRQQVVFADSAATVLLCPRCKSTDTLD